MFTRCALPFVLSLLAACPLAAEIPLRPEDETRLERYEKTAGSALLLALSAGAENDVATLVKALSGAPLVALDQTLQGEWNCRTLRLGGATPLTVYKAFKCRFTLQQDGFLFEKRSGSQRTTGKITYRNGRAIYVGMGHTANTIPPTYAELPMDFMSTDEIRTHIAIFERTSPTRARLLFPAPSSVSDLEILELTR